MPVIMVQQVSINVCLIVNGCWDRDICIYKYSSIVYRIKR